MEVRVVQNWGEPACKDEGAAQRRFQSWCGGSQSFGSLVLTKRGTHYTKQLRTGEGKSVKLAPVLDLVRAGCRGCKESLRSRILDFELPFFLEKKVKMA